MRLVRNVAYLCVALIGTGLLLYFALGVIIMGGDAIPQGPRTSLPSPRRLSTGATYALTQECQVTLVETDNLDLGVWFASIRSGMPDDKVAHPYQLGNTIACLNPSGRRIQMTIDAIDAGGVHLTFAWAAH